MYNPIYIGDSINKIVSEGERRKYYRFRYAPYYGGIATADCVGCNLRCVYCWAWRIISNPKKYGKFYSPSEVVEKLLKIAREEGVKRVRISGNEPTLNKEHLLKVLDSIPNKISFILETNGVLIGYDEKYAGELKKFKNLHVRVSLKGSSKEEFSKFTGASPEWFEFQLKALKNLVKNGVECHAAVIEIAEDISSLRERVEKIGTWLEVEPLIRYQHVVRRLRRIGIRV